MAVTGIALIERVVDVVEFYLSARPALEMLPTSSDFGFLEFLLSDICQEYSYLFHTEMCM